MPILQNIEPKGVFRYFEEICKIPHGSKNTNKISDYIVAFAEQNELFYVQDEFDNVIIKKSGSKGYEDAEPVILQGHIDMVCEKLPGSTKNMETEGVDIIVDGDYIRADGTTLGGDDGIAVAMMLDILASKTYAHPPIEAVFTSDEEIGLIGAANLDMSVLNSKRLINIDSEEEGIFTVGCAGGNRTECSFKIETDNYDGEYRTIKVDGLLGGHSGVEIDKGRANANMLMGKILHRLSQKCDFRIVSINGGLKDNAIPRETVAVIKINDLSSLSDVCNELQNEFVKEFETTDKDILISIIDQGTGAAFTKHSTEKIINFLNNAPNGIIKMNEHIKTLVQTSLNLGILKTENGVVSASFGVRSSVDAEKAQLVEQLKCLTKRLEGEIEVSGDYPGWDYTGSSELKDLMVSIFEKQYGYQPKVVTIHAGLECGLFSSKIKGLDCISIGPDMYDIHTTSERMNILSVQRVYKMLLETLKQMK